MTRSKPGCPHNRRRKYPKIFLFYLYYYFIYLILVFDKETMLIPFLSKHIPVLFLIKARWALLHYYFSSHVEAALWYCQEVLKGGKRRGHQEIRHRERERGKEQSTHKSMCTHFKLFHVHVCTHSCMTCLITEEKRNKPDP